MHTIPWNPASYIPSSYTPPAWSDPDEQSADPVAYRTPPPSGMLAGAEELYNATARVVARVMERVDGDEEASWPGEDDPAGGVPLPVCTSQGTPQDRWGHQTEETVTGWMLWFPFAAVVAADVVIDRGDLVILDGGLRGDIKLRVESKMVDYAQSGVDWYVVASQVE